MQRAVPEDPNTDPLQVRIGDEIIAAGLAWIREQNNGYSLSDVPPEVFGKAAEKAMGVMNGMNAKPTTPRP